MKIDPRITITIRKYQSFIIAAVIFAFTTKFLTDTLIPNFRKYEAVKVKIAANTEKMSSLNRTYLKYNTIDISKYATNLTKLNNILPNDKDYISVFNRLDAIQKKTGVTVRSLDVELGTISTASAAKKQDKNASYFTYNLQLSGTDEEIDGFIKQAKDLSGRIFTVDTVKWEFKKDTNNAAIDGKIYYLPSRTDITAEILLNQKDEDLFDKIVSNQNITFTQNTTTRSQERTGKTNLFSKE